MASRRPRVLFCAATPMNVAVLRPVLDRLAGDPRLDLAVTAHHRARSLYASLEGPPLPAGVRVLGHLRARLARADLALCPGFYFRGGRRRAQVFHGVSFKSYGVSEKLEDYDEAFVIGEFHHRQLVRAGLDRTVTLRKVGMPKTDPLVRGTIARDDVLRGLSLDPARPAVLYAPTRSSRVGSSLDVLGREVIRRLVSLEECSVLIKLHDRSLRRWRKDVDLDWEEELATYRDHPRVRLATGHDVVPLLAAADLLVSDVSSVVNEYLLRDRPIVYLDLPEQDAWIRERAAELGEGDLLGWGREPGTVVADPAGLPEAVRDGLAHPERRSELRRRNAGIFFYHPGRATEATAAAIHEILGLEPPGGPS